MGVGFAAEIGYLNGEQLHETSDLTIRGYMV